MVRIYVCWRAHFSEQLSIDAVREGQTGLLVDPTDPSAVAGVVIRLLTGRQFAARLGQAGSQWVRRERTWEATVAAVMSHLSIEGNSAVVSGKGHDRE